MILINKKKYYISILLGIIFFIQFSCSKKTDNVTPLVTSDNYNLTIPLGLGQMNIPSDNPLTNKGVSLGKMLFYDPILSGNNKMACASCHLQNYAFTDSSNALSEGIDGKIGTRNSMPLFNLGYATQFFWDGGAKDLESQVVGPIQNPVEMHQNLAEAITELNQSTKYPKLFSDAFGTTPITTLQLMKAIAQFERTLLSANTKYDKYKAGQQTLTQEELNGLAIFTNPQKGDCNHCHTLGGTFTDFEYRKNGLDSISNDKGRALITLKEFDNGKFKTPTVRNLKFTAPYMHDGRFKTLEEVVQHYNVGFKYPANLDANLKFAKKGRISPQEEKDLIAFLNTLNDESLTTNPNFKK